jgi:methyltransferase family protein
LFVTFAVEPRTESAPRCALVVFSSCALELPVVRGGETRVAVPVPATHVGVRVGLAFELVDGRVVVEWEPGSRALRGDPAGALFARFGSELSAREARRVLEIGSRARSGTEHRDVLPDDCSYTGLDVRAGPNVDVVGDVHDLGAVLAGQQFDAVYSLSVFEHVLMPWKALLEINGVLAPGGLLFIATHQTYPLHDEPWDFWRFSDQAWRALLNPATGFEIMATALGEPSAVVPRYATSVSWNIQAGPAYLVSSVLARKIGDPSVSWPVDAATIVAGEYPQ